MADAHETDRGDGADDGASAGVLPEPLRGVTPPYRGRFDTEMDVFLTLIFRPLVVPLLSVFPFVALLQGLVCLLDR